MLQKILYGGEKWESQRKSQVQRRVPGFRKDFLKQKQIERCRFDMHMSQKEFAAYMGVSQGMISKWESREYNFTVRSLNEICQKLNLKFNISFDSLCAKTDYKIVRWDRDYIAKNKKNSNWATALTNKEAIA